jgi:hypothetical protein
VRIAFGASGVGCIVQGSALCLPLVLEPDCHGLGLPKREKRAIEHGRASFRGEMLTCHPAVRLRRVLHEMDASFDGKGPRAS